MTRVLWHATMSLDGFITGPGGDVSWMADYDAPNPTATEVVGKIGAVLIGNRTFRGDDVNKGAPTEDARAYGGAFNGPHFVLTHHVPDPPVPGFAFVTDLDSAVAAAKDAAGDRYVAVLGASTAQQCLDAGLLDEILVHVAPVLLGDGVRMFNRTGHAKVPLERIALTESTEVTNLWFRVVK
jgi:dihydrofolate reductase